MRKEDVIIIIIINCNWRGWPKKKNCNWRRYNGSEERRSAVEHQISRQLYFPSPDNTSAAHPISSNQDRLPLTSHMCHSLTKPYWHLLTQMGPTTIPIFHLRAGAHFFTLVWVSCLFLQLRHRLSQWVVRHPRDIIIRGINSFVWNRGRVMEKKQPPRHPHDLSVFIRGPTHSPLPSHEKCLKIKYIFLFIV